MSEPVEVLPRRSSDVFDYGGSYAPRDLVKQPGCGFLIACVVLAFGLELVDVVLGNRLDRFGIWPREFRGIIGILFSPWLHGGFLHWFLNSLSFLMLGGIVMAAERRKFLMSTILLVILSGAGTWLIGRGGSPHIGASGLIYGYFGYIFGKALFDRRMRWALAALFVGVFYGGLIFGVFPTDQPVSWEGHLSGLLGGLWLASRRSRLKNSGINI